MSPQAGRQRALPRLDAPASRALHAVLDAVRQQRSSYLRLRVVMVRVLERWPLAFWCRPYQPHLHSQEVAAENFTSTVDWPQLLGTDLCAFGVAGLLSDSSSCTLCGDCGDSLSAARLAWLRGECQQFRFELQAGDPLEAAFLAHLVEDRAAGTASYVEFLCDIHRRIQNKSSRD